jgi:hypothetical protein
MRRDNLIMIIIDNFENESLNMKKYLKIKNILQINGDSNFIIV